MQVDVRLFLRFFSYPYRALSSAFQRMDTIKTRTTTRILMTDPSSISFPSGDSAELPIISCSQTLQSIQEAAHHISVPLLPIAFPTETVYGLGAVATNPDASLKIFSTKGRPADNPLIVHVSSMSMLQSILPPGYTPPPTYQILMKKFWPGPLTLLFPRDASRIPDIITAGQSSVAVRMPSHPVARALIAFANVPIAAPSANSSGKPSPTKADHVLQDLGGKIDIILDGGACKVGLESTVVDGLGDDGNIRVLRPGGVTVEQIESSLEELPSKPRVLVHRRDYVDEATEMAPTTPGMKYRHYSPSVPVILLQTDQPSSAAPSKIEDIIESLSSQISSTTSLLCIGLLTLDDSPLGKCFSRLDKIEWRRFSLGPATDLSVASQRLFDGLISLEREGVQAILVEAIKEENEGLAVMNRIRKAASETRCIAIEAAV